jgi:hypothetical protein
MTIAQFPSRPVRLSASRASRAEKSAGWIAMAHQALLFAFMLFTFIGTQPLVVTTPEERLAGNPLDRFSLLAMTAAAVALIWARRDEAMAILRANRCLIAAVLFCGLSIAWSDYPELTLRRGMVLGFMTTIALGIAVSVDDLRLLHARLFGLMVFVIAFNLVATALFPEIANTSLGVAGIYGQKNSAGLVAMIAVIVCVSYSFGAQSASEIVLGLIGAAMAFFFLELTQSKTSSGLCMLALGLGFLFWCAHRTGKGFALLALGGLVLLPAGLIVFALAYDFDGQTMLEAVVADPTFTGRDELWAFAWRSALKAPWLGHGYGAFWDVGAVNDPLVKLEPGTWLGDIDIGAINQAHDGYLELFLQIGLPMTFVLVFGLGAALFAITGRAVTARGAGVQAAYAMMAMLLFLTLLHNLTEASLLIRGAPLCSVFLLLCFVGARRPPEPEILS